MTRERLSDDDVAFYADATVIYPLLRGDTSFTTTIRALAREVQERRAVEDRLRELPYNDEASRYADGWNHCRQAVIRLLDGES